MKKTIQTLKSIAAVLGVLATLSGAAWWIFDIDMRSFKSVDQRVQAEDYFNQRPSAKQEQRQLILDSINTANAIKSRAKRDTILREILNRQKHQDSINLLNADQMYQIKEEIKNIH